MAFNSAGLLDIFGKRRLSQIPFRPGLCPGERLQRESKILNSSATVEYVPDADTGVGAAKMIYNDLINGSLPDNLAGKLYNVIADLDEVGATLYRRLVEGKPIVRGVKSMSLRTRSEQAPNPDSRVTLAEEKDALGINRIQLDWRLTEIDKRTVRTLVRSIGAEFGRLNYGRVRVPDWLAIDDDAWSPELIGGNHHMGTTRMSENPKQGVVDKNCRVHSVGNLYVAGSSVFTTSGYANPTLTIVALAVRLADHLKQQFA
ncbi:MAG: hypothetical protein HQ511_05645 [Rhodospirillales bacterium]|nr:hypothetical protein [Rhodospirillales bacterium]